MKVHDSRSRSPNVARPNRASLRCSVDPLLIDTNVVSELRKPKPHGAAVAWLHSLELGQGFFSAVTFGEIQRGVELTRRQDPVKANEIEAWAAQLERTSQVLSMPRVFENMPA